MGACAAQRGRRGRQEEAALDAYAAEGSGLDTYSAADEEADPALAALASNIPGVPGEDYPIYSEAPETAFSCDGQVDGGYYADPEAECQAFHICTADGTGGLAKYSFLCPNGTLFNQNYFICDWWFNFDCSTAEDLYSLNDEIAAERAALAGEASDAQDTYAAPADEYAAAGSGDYYDESADYYEAPAPVAPPPAATEATDYADYEASGEALSGYGEETTVVAEYAAPARRGRGGRRGRAGRRGPARRGRNQRRPSRAGRRFRG